MELQLPLSPTVRFGNNDIVSTFKTCKPVLKKETTRKDNVIKNCKDERITGPGVVTQNRHKWLGSYNHVRTYSLTLTPSSVKK